MTSEVLRRVSVGHLVDMTEPSKENTYILNCENCGANKVVTFDYNRYSYILKCTKCHHTTFITEKVANDLKIVYNIKCPEPNCGADVKPRRKKGQRSFSFFGCTNYPKCKGLVSFKDIAV
jgi:ssDNA-binding Zn-finger/Zn-ribbon topoisomerase 1